MWLSVVVYIFIVYVASGTHNDTGVVVCVGIYIHTHADTRSCTFRQEPNDINATKPHQYKSKPPITRTSDPLGPARVPEKRRSSSSGVCSIREASASAPPSPVADLCVCLWGYMYRV